jgi:hypothetical protein
LEGALAWAEARAKARGYKRVIVIGDGVATAGDTEASGLAAKAARLKAAGVERLDAVAVGGIRDEVTLKKLTTAGLERDGVLVDGSLDPATLERKLTLATRSGIPVAIEGARWQWPTTLDGVQAGDEVRVYAEVPEGRPVRVSVDGATGSALDLTPVERPLLERSWARAKIESLLDGTASGRPKADVAREVIALSTTYRVLSPYTSLLVLETEADFARFRLDRKALSDILTVSGGRLAVAKRQPPAPLDGGGSTESRLAKAESGAPVVRPSALSAAPTLAPELTARGTMWGSDIGESFGAGGLVLLGVGEGGGGRGEGIGLGAVGVVGHGAGTGSGTGFGSGHGRLAGEHRAATPQVRRGATAVSRAVSLRPGDVTPSPSPSMAPPPEASRIEPYTGRFKTVMDLVGAGGAKAALEGAYAWHREAPGDVMALVALGEALEGAREPAAAARVYGSIVDLFPARADLRRFAGERLERLGPAGPAMDEALDTFEKAEEERPDHPQSHRLLAFARLRRGDFAGAFAAAERGNRQPYPPGRFLGVDRILREDLGLIAAAWIKAEPGRRAEILDKLANAGGTREEGPSLRFLLSWETDANDVDFHIHDAEGAHAFYGHPDLPSGGRLYADVTTGYGPECFTIRLPRERRSASYRLEAQYYSRGPMGYGMGKLEIIDHDGKGGLTFEERPFVVMADGAFVDLGTVTR